MSTALATSMSYERYSPTGFAESPNLWRQRGSRVVPFSLPDSSSQSDYTLEMPELPTGSLHKAHANLEHDLFFKKLELKNLASGVSMYMEESWRTRMFKQLDILLSPEEWHEEDALPDLSSFQNFLSWYLKAKPQKSPSYGLTSNGLFIAAWINDTGRLVLEFLKSDKVRWFVSKKFNGVDEPDRASGVTDKSRLIESIKAYNPQDWFEIHRDV